MIRFFTTFILLVLMILSPGMAMERIARGASHAEMAVQAPEFSTRIPNAFMPLSRIPRNRVFRAFFSTPPLTYSLTIYNNWGSILFKTDNPDSAWDGTYENTEVPAGGYIYRVTYTDPAGEVHEVNGIVMLIR